MQKVISKKEIEKIVSNKKPLNESSIRLKELKELNEGLQNLDEATWGERLKYLAAKYLPSYKVGDKILGGSKERQRMQAEIQKLMDKEGEGFLKSLNSDIEKNYPEFPNNLEKEDFLKGVLTISAVYDSIIAATKRSNNPITPEQANEYIDNLRKYVNYMMSYKLNRTIYSTMNENYDESEDIQLGEGASSPYVQYDSDMRDEEPFMLHGEKWQFVNAIYPDGKKDIGVYRYAGDMVYSYEWFRRNVVGDKSMGELDEATMADIDADGGLSSDSVKRALARDRTARGGLSGEDEYGSEVMKGLKSNKLPIVLASIGAGLGALGWVAQTDWLREILEYLFNKNEVVGYKDVYQRVVNKLTFNVESGDGFTQTVNKTLGLNLGPNTTTDQFLNLMKQKGFGSTAEEIVRNYGIGGTSPNPRFIGDAAMALNQKGALLKDVFEGVMHGKAGTLMAVNPGPFLAKQIATRVVKAAIIKTTTTGTAMALGLAAAGPWLVAAGIGLIGAGALVKLMRVKGQKSSRAATLNTLLQSLRDIPNPNPVVGKSSEEQPQTGEQGFETSVITTDKEKRKFDSTKLDAQDVEAEPVEPENQKQIGAGEREGQKQISGGKETRKLGAGETVDVDTLKTNLSNFFKDVLRLKPKRRQRIAEEKELDILNPYKDVKTTKQIEDFQKSVEILNALSTSVNLALRNSSILKDNDLKNLLEKIKQNPQHKTIVNIKNLIKENIKNKDLMLRFIAVYLNAIKKTRFGQIQRYVQSVEEKPPVQLDEAVLRGENQINKFLNNFDSDFKSYLNDLYSLLVYLNKPTQKKQTKKPTDVPDYSNIGQLEETKKKKNKYSKKASEFIGKEISHLKKDKGYPQERAVAAAINVAKEKGMKVGAKKKKSK